MCNNEDKGAWLLKKRIDNNNNSILWCHLHGGFCFIQISNKKSHLFRNKVQITLGGVSLRSSGAFFGLKPRHKTYCESIHLSAIDNFFKHVDYS